MAGTRGPAQAGSEHLSVAGYVLDALDPDERAVFAVHLSGCPQCTAQVRELSAVTPWLTDDVAPSPGMRAAVLAAAAATPQDPPTTSAPAEAAPGEPHVPATARPVTRLPANRPRTLLAAVAAVLALVAVTLGVLLVQSHSQRTELQSQAVAVARVLAAPDATTHEGPVAGGGRAVVVVSAAEGQAVFLATGLSRPSAGHVYELWFIDAAGSATAAGTFTPGEHGYAAMPMQGSPAGAAVVGLTVEPAGGSTAPTTKPVAAVSLAS
jgi:anti-sigma factor RsiW